jgi:hypothetical protein
LLSGYLPFFPKLVKVSNVEEYKKWQAYHQDNLPTLPARIKGNYATVISFEQTYKGKTGSPGQTPAGRTLGYASDANAQTPG